ncbi:MAG TPA: collagenase-like protease [Flavobacteriales bacterium]|jgi:putative protease|nr:collagenase-like protease [Flavobacteriales bacterium]
MHRTQSIEVMAPVGSYESLMAAFQGGADAVYFGVEQLNMRARSTINFTTDDLEEVVQLCHDHGVKAYLTINTILYDHDIILMKRILKKAKEADVDAVIVMDQAAIMYARSIGLEVHISTQINITNLEVVKFYAQFADVMVLSRELTLQQIKSICAGVVRDDVRGPSGKLVQIEVFVHGALCMAVSGKCYLSLHTHNSSANRGACKQNCRRTYEVKDSEGNELLIDNEYIMSPKDLNTITFIDKIIEAGVSVLKIEGRSKGPEYVKTVVESYREAAEATLNGTFTPEKATEWNDRMENVFNRGFWGGYYLGKELGEWTDTDGSKAKKRKVFIGDGVKYFSNIGVGEFVLKNGELQDGEEIIITGPTTGIIEMRAKSLRLDDQEVNAVKKGDRFTMPVSEKVRSADKVFKLVSA